LDNRDGIQNVYNPYLDGARAQKLEEEFQ